MANPPILYDGDVRALADMKHLTDVLREFFRNKAQGGAVSPPRYSVEFESAGRLVFTIGGACSSGDQQGYAGFRVYDTFGIEGAAVSQIVAVWTLNTGELSGILLGPSLGALRTGAIGGVAIDIMAKEKVAKCGIIGSGPQAETQLRALLAVRPGTSHIAVFSRSESNRRNFSRRVSDLTGRTIIPVDTALEAVKDADVLICATNSSVPIIDADWLADGAHINTVGSRAMDAHELPVDLAARVTLAATDSLAQMRSLAGGHFLAGTSAGDRMIELSDLASDSRRARANSDITLFCSVGVAGSEVAVGAALLEKYRRGQTDVERVA